MVLVFDTIYEMAPNMGHWYPETQEDKMPEKLARTRAKRGGNRSVMTKLSNKANDLLEVEPINKQRLDFIAASLNEKLNLVKTFEEESIENCAVDEIEAEIQESDEINSRVMDLQGVPKVRSSTL